MNILDKIVAQKKEYLSLKKIETPLSDVQTHPGLERKGISTIAQFQKQRGSVIAEFKRRSPSRSDINMSAMVNQVVPVYESGGAAAVSVLTDQHHFKGSLDDLWMARKLVEIPLLRKDFIIDPYQIYEAKAAGADLILLIAYCLDKSESEALTDLAHELEIEVLFEIHDLHELQKMPDNIDILGVNNRNLKTFQVDYKYAIDIYNELPNEKIKISESGILNKQSYVDTIEAGYKACLIGEFLMKENDPATTIRSLLNAVNNEN